MDAWHLFVDKAFYAILTGLAVYAVRFLEKVARSINELNIKVAQVLEKISEHDGAIKDLQRKRRN